MKPALLPIALLTLSLPAPALAYPARLAYGHSHAYAPSRAFDSAARPAGPHDRGGYRTYTDQAYDELAPYDQAPQYGLAPQYGQAPRYAPPQYASPQYAQPQYAQPQYAQPQYAYPGPSGYSVPAPPRYYPENRPMAYSARQTPLPPARCPLNAGRALMGAALGGLASAALLPRAKDRSWAVPVAAALGGLGGLASASGC